MLLTGSDRGKLGLGHRKPQVPCGVDRQQTGLVLQHKSTPVQEGQSRLYFLRMLHSLNICRKFLWMFYQLVVASLIFYVVACWRGGTPKKDSSGLVKVGWLCGWHEARLTLWWQWQRRVLWKYCWTSWMMSAVLCKLSSQRNWTSDGLFLPSSRTSRAKNSLFPEPSNCTIQGEGEE